VIIKICRDLDCDFKTFKGSLKTACQKAKESGFEVLITDSIKVDYELSKKSSIEIRYPFLDNRFLQTIMSIKNKDSILRLVAENLH
jgi:asparagine synthetase B (glutamine-hydrolysing)